MKPRILVIAPNETVKEIFRKNLQKCNYECIAISKQNLIPENRIIITHDDVLLDNDSILHNVPVAIILDSGYMWPQPVEMPDEEQWMAYQGRLDEYIRNERESRSMWFSLLHIISDTIPLCINPQNAYELATFKPWALQLLKNADVCLPPLYSGNDPDVARKFSKDNGPLFKKIPTFYDCQGEIFSADLLENWDFSSQPISFQAIPSDNFFEIIAIGSEYFPIGLLPIEKEHIETEIINIQNTLNAPMLSLQFVGASKPLLVDFNPAPSIENFDGQTLDTFFDALVQIIERGVL